MITQSYLRKTFHYNPWAGVLTRRATGRRAGFVGSGGYRNTEILGEQHGEHRVIWFYMAGKWPEGEVDHENRDPADNRWHNLDDVTPTVNRRNRSLQKNNRSGHAGVVFNPRISKWAARISVAGRSIHLGTFDDIDFAIHARKAAEIRYGFHKNHGQTSLA